MEDNGPKSGGETALSHLDADGNARMVDVGAKPVTERVAVAKGRVLMRAETGALIASGDIPKGDVFATARIAGIMAAKRTAELIPLCHPLGLDSVTVDLALEPAGTAVEITATCKMRGRTGVEMEAMTAVSTAALTLYDMCKAVDKGMRIMDVRLTYKAGGKSGTFEAA